MLRHRLSRLSTIIFLLALIVVYPLFAAQLTRITASPQGSALVLGFAVSSKVPPQVFMLHQPERVVVDFSNTSTTLSPAALLPRTALIRRVRLGHPRPQSLRLVFEMTQAVRIKTGAAAQRPWRLTIIPTQHRAVVGPSQHHPAAVISASPHGHRDVIVVLDPGHGGKDPGAIGSKKTKEKQVVLMIAKRLKTLIDRQPGMRAILTRDSDYYIGLRERMTIARRHNADLFIAIHADAFGNPQSHGASVFALSQRGATSEAARWLAAKENYSELGGVNLSTLDDRNGVIRTVLIDLSQTATIGASLQLGHQVLSGLHQMTTLHSPKVEQARFMVLKSPDIPSLLIETGFISNQREEMNLNNPAYQARLCQAIFSGIKQYFWEFPPHGSRIEAMAAPRQYLGQVGNRRFRG